MKKNILLVSCLTVLIMCNHLKADDVLDEWLASAVPPEDCTDLNSGYQTWCGNRYKIYEFGIESWKIKGWHDYGKVSGEYVKSGKSSKHRRNCLVRVKFDFFPRQENNSQGKIFVEFYFDVRSLTWVKSGYHFRGKSSNTKKLWSKGALGTRKAANWAAHLNLPSTANLPVSFKAVKFNVRGINENGAILEDTDWINASDLDTKSIPKTRVESYKKKNIWGQKNTAGWDYYRSIHVKLKKEHEFQRRLSLKSFDILENDEFSLC